MSWWLAMILSLLTTMRSEELRNKKWESVSGPKAGEAKSIGGYAKGCVQGAEKLPLNGKGYQSMRPSRNRRFGHPQLISYIQKYAKRIKRGGLGTMLVGDLGQARGGPSPSGHASHQSGLDVDIWFWRAPVANQRRLTNKERETIGAPTFVDRKAKKIMKNWDRKMTKMLRLATLDKRVARIFVNPAVKRHICETTKNKAWLRKIRPWYAHHDHMHVRLECPESSASCDAQRELPPGDGCDALDWWFREKKKSERKEGKKTYSKKVRRKPLLPEACYDIYPQ